MKIISAKHIVFYISGLVMFSSCKKSFLEVQPKGTTLESNYYQNASQVFTGVVSVYDVLGQETGASTYDDKAALLNVASDDCYAGGGSSSDIPQWQSWNNFTVDAAHGPQLDLWDKSYSGIYRANLVLGKMNGVADLTAIQKGRYTAEVKFLRAYYYFDLVRLFRNVPLIITPIPQADYYNVTQAKPEEVYAQIEKDLLDAVAEPNLPNTVSAATEGGRVTKGAAKALLGKVYLYEQKWAEAAQQLADVNGTPGGTSQYGYKLLSNFADIFRPDNKFNSESVFEIVHTSVARQDWGSWGAFEGNVGVQMSGPRNYNGPIYVTGYGFDVVTTNLVNSIYGDPRYPYTVANIDSIVNASPGTRSYEKSYQNTGYFVEKYAPKAAYRSSLGGVADLNYPNDYIEIRLADTYLMEAEALMHTGSNTPRAQQLFDAVRARAGVASLPVTLDAIYNERHLELATEGHRFFDLVRTGQAAAVLAFKGYQPKKNEVLPIPLQELNNTKLVQNPGY